MENNIAFFSFMQFYNNKYNYYSLYTLINNTYKYYAMKLNENGNPRVV